MATRLVGLRCIHRRLSPYSETIGDLPEEQQHPPVLCIVQSETKSPECRAPGLVAFVRVRVAAKFQIEETVGEKGQVLLKSVCVYIFNYDNLPAYTCGFTENHERVRCVMENSEE